MGEMHKFTAPRRSFEGRVPSIVVDKGEIETEAKIPLPAMTRSGYNEPAQASRCVDCGTAPCFQGVGKDAQGCPFSRPIPDIHEREVEAEKILRQAFEALKALDPETAKQLEAEIRDINHPDAPFLRARFPIKVFNALEGANFALVKDWREAFDSNMRIAFDFSREKGPMGDIYGRICPESLCEKSCTTAFSGHGAITIRMNETILWDYAWESGWVQPIDPKADKGKNILIVGSGFAGYAAAERLCEEGYQVTIVERNEAPGERGNDQILQYKSLQERFERHYDRLETSGVNIVLNTEVGGDEAHSLKALKERFNADAILITSGAPKAKLFHLNGDAADNLVPWNQFTRAQQDLGRTGKDLPENLNAKDKVVAVIGTADTAVDCVRTAALEGAREVIVISRHDKQSAADMDAVNAMHKEAGSRFKFQAWMSPENLSYTDDGSRMVLSGNDNEEGHEGRHRLEVDMVVSAVGSETGDQKEIFGLKDASLKKDGSFDVVGVPREIADNNPIRGVGAGFVTMLDDAFVLAAGQSVRGGNSLAAVCGRDGRDAANWLMQQLERNDGHLPFEGLYALSSKVPLAQKLG
jgi:glutamate synthase (NADPH/NADH) small chain